MSPCTVYAKRHDGQIRFYDCRNKQDARRLSRALEQHPDVEWVEIEERKAGEPR